MISYSGSIDPTNVPFNQSFNLAQFDPTLGTLTGVTISFAESVTAVVRVNNVDSVSHPFADATASVPLLLTGPDGTQVSESATTTGQSGMATPGVSSWPGQSGSDTRTTVVAAANFAAYTGAGSFGQYTVVTTRAAYSGVDSDGQGAIFFGGSATAGGMATVTYTYTPSAVLVPEPRGLALFGLSSSALGLMVWLRRRGLMA